jgi:hypothetical protein
MNDIAEAKTKLPLPSLLHQVGLGQHAKKSARCPFHEDERNSFSVWQRNGVWFWKCHTGCGKGDEITFLEKHKGISNKEATKLYLQMANGAPAPAQTLPKLKPEPQPIDWERCVAALKPKDLVRLGNERWYSRGFCRWLYGKKLVGLHNGNFAFPVGNGTVVGAHIRQDDDSWFFTPKGIKTAPLVIGELSTAKQVHVFESQWDMLAFADRTDLYQERDVAFISTRSASNAALVKGLIPQSASVCAWPQNDKAGEKWLNNLVAHTGAKVAKSVVPAPHKDVNEWTKAGATAEDICAALFRNELIELSAPFIAGRSGQPREPRIRFFTPSELRDFKPDNELVLVGDCQITRGEVFVIGGEPGVGKSLASTQLAVSGATQRDWFGLKVHRQFRTMIVQTENGRYRLRLEFSERDCDEIENWVRISEPPPFGLTLTNTEFQEDIRATLDSFKPECVIFDPWNAAARDDKQRDYIETFDALRNLLPTGSDKPALGVDAHTRKPQPKEKRTGGTGLMHLLAGSYVLTSVPRSIFVMTRGSEDETDNSVVFFNPKNSNGQNAARSAWIRALNGFTPATDFDWEEFDRPPEERKIITLNQISKVFDGGEKLLYLNDAAHDLATLAQVRDTSAYRALKLDGKFAEYLSEVGERIKFSLPSSLGILGERKKGPNL